MKPSPLCLTVALLLAGCASAPKEPPTASADAQSCDREERIGSHIPNRECAPAMTPEERQRAMDAVRASSRLPGPGNGN